MAFECERFSVSRYTRSRRLTNISRRGLGTQFSSFPHLRLDRTRCGGPARVLCTWGRRRVGWRRRGPRRWRGWRASAETPASPRWTVPAPAVPNPTYSLCKQIKNIEIQQWRDARRFPVRFELIEPFEMVHYFAKFMGEIILLSILVSWTILGHMQPVCIVFLVIDSILRKTTILNIKNNLQYIIFINIIHYYYRQYKFTRYFLMNTFKIPDLLRMNLMETSVWFIQSRWVWIHITITGIAL